MGQSILVIDSCRAGGSFDTLNYVLSDHIYFVRTHEMPTVSIFDWTGFLLECFLSVSPQHFVILYKQRMYLNCFPCLPVRRIYGTLSTNLNTLLFCYRN